MKFISPVQANVSITKLYDLDETQRAIDVLQRAGFEVSSLSLSISAAIVPLAAVEKPA